MFAATPPDDYDRRPTTEEEALLNLVLPKGSLEAATIRLFEEADLAVVRGGERDYRGEIDDPRIDSVRFLRPQEIPNYVADGLFDVGITGRDWITETDARVQTITELRYSKNTQRPVRIVLAVDGASGILSPGDVAAGTRISTEYPEIARRYFAKLGIDVKISLSYGATEAKVPDIVDAIVDNTETGSSLRAAGMRIVDTLLESYTELIVNPESYADREKRQAVDEISLLLRGALDARGRVLVKLNAREDQLAAITEVLPSMKAPTVSKLAGGDYYAVETVVPKSQINLLIPVLKSKGAEDIIEMQISKVVD